MHDRASREAGQRVACDLHVLWGERGVIAGSSTRRPIGAPPAAAPSPAWRWPPATSSRRAARRRGRRADTLPHGLSRHAAPALPPLASCSRVNARGTDEVVDERLAAQNRRVVPDPLCAWIGSAIGLLLSALAWVAGGGAGAIVATLAFAGLVGVGLRDVRQPRHSVLRNYPVIGHMRFFFEFIRPEIRQYFIESDSERLPFSRNQRSLVYQRAKGEPDKRPFGTHRDVGAVGYEWLNHSMSPTVLGSHDFRITVGSAPSCSQPYSASIFNISAMSFGALSANAILALNAGAQRGGFAHDTGEGSISRHHRHKRRRSDLGDRLGLLRLPRCRGPLR